MIPLEDSTVRSRVFSGSRQRVHARPHGRGLLARIALAGLALTLAACGGGGDGGNGEKAARFHFKVHGQPASEDFVAYVADPAAKTAARAQLALPAHERLLHASGRVAHGSGGFNLGWNWHFSGAVTLERVSIEACDTLPSMVAADVAYWIRSGTGVCPWGSYVHAELP